jgi:hypothetical protein
VCNFRQLELQWNRGVHPPDAQNRVDTINIGIQAIKRRERDFKAAFEHSKANARLNEEATRKRIGYVKYLTKEKNIGCCHNRTPYWDGYHT